MSIELTVPTTLKEAVKYKHNFKRANFEGINNYLSNVDWSLMQSSCGTDIDSCVSFFYDKITYAIDLFVPLNKTKSNNHPPWFNKLILNLKNRKNKAYKRFIKSRLRSDYSVYSHLRGQLLVSVKRSYANYINNAQNNLTTDPKRFWSFVNSKKKTNSYPSSMFFSDTQCSNPSDICNQFANFFSSVYVTHDCSQNFVIENAIIDNNINICNLYLTENCIIDALSKIDECKSAGPDNIPPVFLKKCAHSLITPLKYIFNTSLKLGQFPQKWKPSNI